MGVGRLGYEGAQCRVIAERVRLDQRADAVFLVEG